MAALALGIDMPNVPSAAVWRMDRLVLMFNGGRDDFASCDAGLLPSLFDLVADKMIVRGRQRYLGLGENDNVGTIIESTIEMIRVLMDFIFGFVVRRPISVAAAVSGLI
jgi:hypothetical protein